MTLSSDIVLVHSYILSVVALGVTSGQVNLDNQSRCIARRARSVLKNEAGASFG